MAAKQRHKHQKELYSAYKSQNRFAVNRKRKLLKVQKAQPNNLQIAEALGNIKYRRKTPNTAVNSKQKIAAAKLKSQVSRTVVTFDKPNEKSMFKLATRAHTKGVPVAWSTY